VATSAFGRNGYDHTSVQEIADEVGILKGSLYYYFTSKEDLFFEIIREVQREGRAELERALELPVSSLQKVRAFVTTEVRHELESAGPTVLSGDLRWLSAARKEVIRLERREHEGRLHALISAAQAERRVCPDIDPELAAIEILGMTSAICRSDRSRQAIHLAQLAHSVADFVVSGLACDPRTHSPGHRGTEAPVP
jgi:AcrR family transcriptional regulator